MSGFLLRNFALLDPAAGELRAGLSVRIEGSLITAVGEGLDPNGASVIDGGGRILMPGLIDCHVHIHRTILPPAPIMLPSLITAHAGVTLKGMLMRGFTTVRDAGGADFGHKQAVEQGLFIGPRLFVSGRAISQTGGHGDPRSPADLIAPCNCIHLEAGLGRIADGVPEVRRAVRDEIRLGADQIKVMAGGGVASMSDPVDQLQYSMEELEAIVDEAVRSHKYVMAHVYTSEGIRRCMQAGVRTIEHGAFLDEPTAALMASSGTYLSPNLMTTRMIAVEGLALGYPAVSVEKAKEVLEFGTKALAIANRAGVKMTFSTDLSKAPERMADELVIRTEVLSTQEIIRSATTIGAEVVRMQGRIGVIAEGALADLISVDGDPFADITLLTGQGKHMALIMKAGHFYKNTLA